MGRSDSDASLLDFVGRIYDVASSADGWEPLLEQMAALFDGKAAVFFVRDRLAPETVFLRHWGIPDGFLTDSVQRFSSMDVGLDTLRSVPVGTIVTEGAPPENHVTNDVLEEFLRRWDVERFLGGAVFQDDRRFGVVAVLGSRRRAPFGAAESELLQTLIPHLRRAIELRSHLEENDAHRSVAQDLIERMLTGVVLLDTRGRVLLANATARRIVEKGDGLALSRQQLRATTPADDKLLRKAIDEAIELSAHRDAPGGAALTLRRASGARPYAVLVSPGASAAPASALRIASAIVLIGDPDSALGSAETTAMQLYGLTPSEARLACAVASGESLRSYAAGRGINVTTARFTMKHVLAKTGARRQADLVRMLLTGPAAIAKRSREPS